MVAFGVSLSASSAIEEVARVATATVVTILAPGRGAGAGIVLSADGVVLTNHHVVAGTQDAIRVGLHDGRELEAHVLRVHPDFDLALLKVQAAGLASARWGDSDALRVGELVFAMGNPGGEARVLTCGVVSALGKRAFPVGAARVSNGLIPYVRSDVPLAPGNSGGPLLNARGEVVGINTMIFGGDLSIAIPSATARAWLAMDAAAAAPRDRPARHGGDVRRVRRQPSDDPAQCPQVVV